MHTKHGPVLGSLTSSYRQYNCNFLPFHDKILKLEQFLKSSGSEFRNTGAAYLKDLLPYVLVLTVGTCKIFEYLKYIRT